MHDVGFHLLLARERQLGRVKAALTFVGLASRRAGLSDLPRLMGMIRVYFERLSLGTRTAVAVEGGRPHTRGWRSSGYRDRNGSNSRSETRTSCRVPLVVILRGFVNGTILYELTLNRIKSSNMALASLPADPRGRSRSSGVWKAILLAFRVSRLAPRALACLDRFCFVVHRTSVDDAACVCPATQPQHLKAAQPQAHAKCQLSRLVILSPVVDILEGLPRPFPPSPSSAARSHPSAAAIASQLHLLALCVPQLYWAVFSMRVTGSPRHASPQHILGFFFSCRSGTDATLSPLHLSMSSRPGYLPRYQSNGPPARCSDGPTPVLEPPS